MCDTSYNQVEKSNKSYYFDSNKFVRDLVHGYVYLTKFDIDLISTEQFQRLREIRQLTCQSVYPDARHTRFEHSLGVMELTRGVINHLNTNGFISEKSRETKIINEQLQFNASIAALLHDVGHCPFSHMGEVEFNDDEIWERLYNDVIERDDIVGADLINLFKEINEKNKKRPGAIHEQLSCIMILEKFNDLLSQVKEKEILLDSQEYLYVDYELVLRSILGIEYDTSNNKNYEKNKEKNIIVNLINSKAFDMDKLDYVMRDSFYTGIGTPKIDTNRLFRNIFLNSENDYRLIFKNRAVPVLQNFIESRDGLYMYVYNHHTAVFSDFMISYIFRRLAHNKRDFISMVNLLLDMDKKSKTDYELKNDLFEENDYETAKDWIKNNVGNGMVPKEYLFSSEAVIDHNRSDSDLISLLNVLSNQIGDQASIYDELKTEIENSLYYYMDVDNLLENEEIKAKRWALSKNIEHSNQLVKKYQRHDYLKPWWKTNSEFNNFLITNFKDDRVREQLCSLISNKSGSLKSHEFRSQLAKNVIYITEKLYQNKIISKLIEPLQTGDFFVIQRSARFFEPETISELDIALKSNEILGSPKDIKYKSGEFYIKMLNNVIPQRDYYSMYAKNSFYIFSKRISDDAVSLEEKNAHYHQIEQVFIFVAEKLITDGEHKFNSNYMETTADEEKAHEKMYKEYINFLS